MSQPWYLWPLQVHCAHLINDDVCLAGLTMVEQEGAYRSGQDLSWGWHYQRWCHDLCGIWANGHFTSNYLLWGFVGFC